MPQPPGNPKSELRAQALDDARTASICLAIIGGLVGMWYLVFTQGYIVVSGMMFLLLPLLGICTLIFAGRSALNFYRSL